MSRAVRILLYVVLLVGAGLLSFTLTARFVSEEPVAAGPVGETESGLDTDPSLLPDPRGDNDEATPAKDDEVECDVWTVGEEEGPVISIYRVEDGELGELCYGDANEAVVQGWEALDEITDPEDLQALRLFAGIESETVVAFTGPLDDEAFGDLVIAVDVLSAVEDLPELRVTMAHEISHVFTQTRDQVDEEPGYKSCDTYYNGYVCFLPDSYIDAWINEFWTAEQLADLPVSGAIDEEGGEDRCSLDPSFLGNYAASHPEEDFAEAFSAFVFAIDVPAAAQPRLAFFEAYPELVEYRDRAQAAGRQGLPNNFDPCG